ncbi:hypothetical protein [Bradyrhizobium sp. F1.13.3]|uniref:hypothetical protein n=1 Tax=Bradyrhizobium sp. F1.13.3 TaxID=3156351 RepID=UPI003396B917
MSTKQQSGDKREVRLADRRRLEAVGRHQERLSMQARRNGDVDALARHSAAAMAVRLRQR